MAAYRVGLLRDLDRLASSQGNVHVATLRGGHGLLFENPRAVADRVLASLG
jgi:hypothetical protein